MVKLTPSAPTTLHPDRAHPQCPSSPQWWCRWCCGEGEEGETGEKSETAPQQVTRCLGIPAQNRSKNMGSGPLRPRRCVLSAALRSRHRLDTAHSTHTAPQALAAALGSAPIPGHGQPSKHPRKQRHTHMHTHRPMQTHTHTHTSPRVAAQVSTNLEAMGTVAESRQRPHSFMHWAAGGGERGPEGAGGSHLHDHPQPALVGAGQGSHRPGELPFSAVSHSSAL